MNDYQFTSEMDQTDAELERSRIIAEQELKHIAKALGYFYWQLRGQGLPADVVANIVIDYHHVQLMYGDNGERGEVGEAE